MKPEEYVTVFAKSAEEAKRALNRKDEPIDLGLPLGKCAPELRMWGYRLPAREPPGQ